MLNIKTYIILFSIVCSGSLSAQVNTNTDNVNVNSMNGNYLRTIGIGQYDLRERKLEGDRLLFEDWVAAQVELVGGKVLTLEAVNYDLMDEYFLINSDKQAYLLPRFKVRYLKTLNYLGEVDNNSSNFSFKKTSDGIRLLQTITDGECALYKYTGVYVRKSNYNPAMDVGTINDTVIKKVEYYITYRDQLRKLPKSRKKAIKQFNKYKKISNYLSKNKVDMKDENDLILLSKYLTNTVK